MRIFAGTATAVGQRRCGSPPPSPPPPPSPTEHGAAEHVYGRGVHLPGPVLPIRPVVQPAIQLGFQLLQFERERPHAGASGRRGWLHAASDHAHVGGRPRRGPARIRSGLPSARPSRRRRARARREPPPPWGNSRQPTLHRRQRVCALRRRCRHSARCTAKRVSVTLSKTQR